MIAVAIAAVGLLIGRVEVITGATPMPTAHRLMLRDGSSIAVRWWGVVGALVEAETADGTIVSIRAARVDLDATQGWRPPSPGRNSNSPPIARGMTTLSKPLPSPRMPATTRPRGSFSIATGSAGRSTPPRPNLTHLPLAEIRARLDALWGPRIELVLKRLERARGDDSRARAAVARLEREREQCAGPLSACLAIDRKIAPARVVATDAGREFESAIREFEQCTEGARRAGASFASYGRSR